jgi:hypothetical protein
MTEKHGILDSLKHLAFEEEPEIAKTEAKPEGAAPHPTVTASTVANGSGIVPGNDEIYKKLLSKTDFEGTEAAATIQKFLGPLAAIPDSAMPPNLKFKTAVLQAKAQAGLTEENILATFDALKATLQKELNSFNTKAQQFVAQDITGRQNRISQITAQITQLQQELAGLSSELVEAQGKATRAQSQFAAALARRSSELEQQKAQYAALLKG